MKANSELESERLAAAVLDHGRFVNRILPGGPSFSSLFTLEHTDALQDSLSWVFIAFYRRRSVSLLSHI